MDKLPGWVWIAGGGVLLLLLLSNGSSSSAQPARTMAPQPPVDTSGVDIARLQGKYGLASSLVNAAGTIDLATIGANAQASHDWYGLASLNADYAGQVRVLNATYFGENLLLDTTGKYAVKLAGIGANRDIDITRINAGRDVDIAGLNANALLGINRENNITERYGLDVQQTLGLARTKADVDIARKNADTAATINAKTQEQQTKRNAWDTAGKIVGTGLSILAFL